MPIKALRVQGFTFYFTFASEVRVQTYTYRYFTLASKCPTFALRHNTSDVCDRDAHSLYVNRVLIAKAMDQRRRKQ